ncbi:GGDEF domain-containing protein [Pseudorhodoferax sp.]|uniref:GGDEF domain-containing protein n=1 Tax=Pseudorhodoferax sp. TaxID=1993553 RepID=UPI002DD67F39|nr:sensor domain-containing diguanylate cyclase [Pseudorhodoferax sp.]
MDHLIDQLSVTVTSARTLEELTRPLLEMLESVTGMESTYLTTIDLQHSVQEILYARNIGRMEIPEGLAVPWGDTLCKRALDANVPFANDVDVRWGDSDAARALGIQTYLSTPVHLTDGELYGTLCAASSGRHELPPKAQRMLSMFATLIAQQVEREQLLQKLLQANARLTALATTDPLTQLANRRALKDGLTRMLALGARQGSAVLVAFVDLDGFKAINDTHGHDVGDLFLIAMADRLRTVLRTEDMAARWGGDEFVVIGLGPDRLDQLPAARLAFQERVLQATVGDYRLDSVALAYPGASVGVLGVAPQTQDADEALKAADAAMYRVKQERRAAARKPG